MKKEKQQRTAKNLETIMDAFEISEVACNDENEKTFNQIRKLLNYPDPDGTFFSFSPLSSNTEELTKKIQSNWKKTIGTGIEKTIRSFLESKSKSKSKSKSRKKTLTF